MARLNVYSIRDNKVSSFGTPFFSVSDVTATRSLIRAIGDSQLQLSMFAEDFDLYTFGSYNDSDGSFDLLKQPKFVVSAVSLKQIAATALPPSSGDRKEVSNG